MNSRPSFATEVAPPRHRQWRVRPTRFAWFALIIVAAMALAAINYQANAAWLLVAMVLCAGPLSLLAARRNVAGLAVARGDEVMVSAESPVALAITLLNPGRREVVAVQVRCPGAVGATLVLHVAAQAQTRLTVVGPAVARGVYTAHTLELATRFPFGLWAVTRRIALPGVVVVAHPSPQGRSLASLAQAQLRHVSDGDFRGVRPWQAGDSPRHIDWKAAARHDEALHIKEWGGHAPEIHWLDWAVVPGGEAVRLGQLTRWVIEAGQHGWRFGLRLPGQTCPPGSGDAHVRSCLRALAAWQPSVAPS